MAGVHQNSADLTEYLRAWLKHHRLDRYCDQFVEADCILSVDIVQLTEEDLADCGITSNMPKRRLMSAVSKLRLLRRWLCSHNLEECLEAVFQSGIYSLQRILDMSAPDQQMLLSSDAMNDVQRDRCRRAVMDIKKMEQWLVDHNLESLFHAFVSNSFTATQNIFDMTEMDLESCGITKPKTIQRVMAAIESASGKSSAGKEVASAGEKKMPMIQSLSDGSMIFAGKYKCIVSAGNLARRQGSEVYLAETCRGIQKKLVVKLSPSDCACLEGQILQYLHTAGPQLIAPHVVAMEDFLPSGGPDQQHVLVLERGDADLAQCLPYLCTAPQPVKHATSWMLLNACSAMSRLGIVWGDLKHANFVQFHSKTPGMPPSWKCIDFDSARKTNTVMTSFAQHAELLSDVPDTYEPDSDAMVTPGYVSPERAQGILQGRPVRADPKQDIFVLGLILYRIYSGSDYFGPSELEADVYLEKLAAPDFAANLGAVRDEDVKRLLAHMLPRDPSARHGYQQLLHESIWSGQTNAKASRLASTILRRMDNIEDLALRIHRDSGRRMDLLRNINGDQLRAMKHMDTRFKQMEVRLAQTGQTLQNALRRTIDLQKSDTVPFHVLLLPALQDVDALFEWRVAMDQVGLSSDTLGFWFDLYVGAEGHALVPDKIEKSESPAHDAIRIRLTPTRVVQLSPLLYVFTRLLSVAIQHERVDSIPLPSDAVENLVDGQDASPDAKISMLAKLASCYENILTASNQLATAQCMLDALVDAVDDVDSGDLTTAGETKLNSVHHGLAGAFAALRSALRDNTSWDQFADAGPMCKVYNKKLGTVHWVRRAHAATVLDNCADLVADLSGLDSAAKLEQEILNLQVQLAECEEREGVFEFSGDRKGQHSASDASSGIGIDPALHGSALDELAEKLTTELELKLQELRRLRAGSDSPPTAPATDQPNPDAPTPEIPAGPRRRSGAAEWFCRDAELRFKTDLTRQLEDRGIDSIFDLAEVEAKVVDDLVTAHAKRGEKKRWCKTSAAAKLQQLRTMARSILMRPSITVMQWMEAIFGLPQELEVYAREEDFMEMDISTFYEERDSMMQEGARQGWSPDTVSLCERTWTHVAASLQCRELQSFMRRHVERYGDAAIQNATLLLLGNRMSEQIANMSLGDPAECERFVCDRGSQYIADAVGKNALVASHPNYVDGLVDIILFQGISCAKLLHLVIDSNELENSIRQALLHLIVLGHGAIQNSEEYGAPVTDQIVSQRNASQLVALLDNASEMERTVDAAVRSVLISMITSIAEKMISAQNVQENVATIAGELNAVELRSLLDDAAQLEHRVGGFILARNYIVSKFGAEGTVTSKKDFKPSGWSFSGCTAVFMAAFEGKLDVVRALVEVMGADAEAKEDSTGFTSVYAAVMGGDHAELVRYLTVERGVRVDTPTSEYGFTPLHLASFHGRYESLAVLLESPTSTVDVINARNSVGYTALKCALIHNHPACADLLRAHGATE